MLNKHWTILAVTVVLVALAISGCSGPATTQAKSDDTPQDVVVNYWKNIDKGDYDAAYNLAYPVQNISKQAWIDDHRAMWGDNGTNIRIYNFTVIGNQTLDPATFPGNFTGTESVLVQTDVAYYGKNTSGVSQFAAVKTADGWKFYGAY